jgi:hypothetical protein
VLSCVTKDSENILGFFGWAFELSGEINPGCHICDMCDSCHKIIAPLLPLIFTHPFLLLWSLSHCKINHLGTWTLFLVLGGISISPSEFFNLTFFFLGVIFVLLPLFSTGNLYLDSFESFIHLYGLVCHLYHLYWHIVLKIRFFDF